MATAPLFVADLDTLKADLRLSGVPSGVDADAIIQSACRQVRTQFYSVLGLARVQAILLWTSSDNPTTENEILRSIAEECETLMVRVVLMDRLPNLFMDNSGGGLEFLNQEGAFRSTPRGDLEGQRKRAQTQILEWMALLSGDVALGEGADVQIATQAGQTPRIFPGGDLVGGNERLWGDPTRPIEGEES